MSEIFEPINGLPNVGVIAGMSGGKTSVANHLVNKFQYNRLALAMPIKSIEAFLDTDMSMAKQIAMAYHSIWNSRHQSDFALHEFEIDYILRTAQEIPREDPKPRKRLQFMGTEGFREGISENYWIDIWDSIVKETSRGNGSCRFVCDDVRFPNEVEYFASNAFLIYLDVDVDVQIERCTRLGQKVNADTFNHPSEKFIRQIKDDLIADKYGPNYVILDSNVDLNTLLPEVTRVLKTIKAKNETIV
jgi:shikimate kinase